MIMTRFTHIQIKQKRIKVSLIVDLAISKNNYQISWPFCLQLIVHEYNRILNVKLQAVIHLYVLEILPRMMPSSPIISGQHQKATKSGNYL